jgi:predicted aspartyl protease
MSVIQAGNTTTTSLIYTGDTTGNLVFTTGGANTVALTLSNTQAATFASNVIVTGSITATGGVIQGANAAPAFSVYPNSNTALTAGVNALIALGAKNFDTNTCFNNTGSTATLNGLSVPAYAFCPNVPGYYQVSFAFAGNNGAAQTTQGALYKNGSAYASGGWLTNSASGGGACLGTTLVYLNGTGDYIQFYVNSNLTMGTTVSSYYSYFTGFLARSA